MIFFFLLGIHSFIQTLHTESLLNGRLSASSKGAGVSQEGTAWSLENKQ